MIGVTPFCLPKTDLSVTLSAPSIAFSPASLTWTTLSSRTVFVRVKGMVVGSYPLAMSVSGTDAGRFSPLSGRNVLIKPKEDLVLGSIPSILDISQMAFVNVTSKYMETNLSLVTTSTPPGVTASVVMFTATTTQNFSFSHSIAGRFVFGYTVIGGDAAFYNTPTGGAVVHFRGKWTDVSLNYLSPCAAGQPVSAVLRFSLSGIGLSAGTDF